MTIRSNSCTSKRACTPAAAARGVFSLEIIDERPGSFVAQVTGAGAAAAFQDEAGGHRWQRVPPNEKRGRVHTSTVTVAVLPEPAAAELVLADGELEFTACRGSGAGGQARNKTSNAVQLRHLPTNTLVRCESERSQAQNRRTALALLRARLWDAKVTTIADARAADRKAQVGSGMRGDKRRTVRTQDDQVHDHVTGRRWRYRDYVRGDW